MRLGKVKKLILLIIVSFVVGGCAGRSATDNVLDALRVGTDIILDTGGGVYF